MSARDDALILLGFKAGNEPSHQEIDKQFRLLAKQYHPDKNPDKNAKTKFSELSAAHAFLKKPRAEQEAPNASINELFQSFFSPTSTVLFSNLFDDFDNSHYTAKKANCIRFHYGYRGSQSWSFLDFDNTIDFEKRWNNDPNVPRTLQCQILKHAANKLTPEGAQILVDHILKLEKLRSFKDVANLLTPEQHALIAMHIDKNKEIYSQDFKVAQLREERIRNRRNSSELRWIAMGALVGGLLSFTLGLSILSTLVMFPLSMSIFAITRKFLKDTPLDPPYNKQAITAMAYSKEEKEALHSGVEAENWKGYFLSFAKLPAYTHYSAYNAGERYAQIEESECIATIKEMKKGLS